MKRIGILSDTHGFFDPKFAEHFAECDEIWHAGDIGSLLVLERLRAIAPVVRAVRGNIDYGDILYMCDSVDIFRVEEVNVLLVHIGGYPGKYAPGLEDLLIRNDINLMVCGHSHILKVMHDRRNNILHINPGAAGHQGWQTKRTIIRLTIDGADMRDLEVIELS